MARHITLSDEDYATLEAVSERTGSSVEELVRQAIAACLANTQAAPREVSYLYPAGKRPSPTEHDAMERLAEKIGAHKPWLSDIIIEDRGPR